MKKVLVIFGTRPEAIKMCPLVLEMKKSEKLETLVCVTGQHREMLKQVLDIFKVVPDYDMAIMKKGQDLTDVTTAILTGMREILKKEKPDIVLVHGDTSTAFAASLADKTIFRIKSVNLGAARCSQWTRYIGAQYSVYRLTDCVIFPLLFLRL